MRILVSGFEPFHRWKTNPTDPLVRALEASPPPGVAVRAVVLPVSYRDAPQVLLRELESQAPDALVMFGLAPRPAALRIERLAVNLGDASIPDARGCVLQDAALEPAGPAAYFGRFPVRSALEALQAAGIPAVRSLSAGAYVCNATYYRVAHHLHRTGRELPFGFVHVPPTEVERDEAAGEILPAETVWRGAALILGLLAAGEPPPPAT